MAMEGPFWDNPPKVMVRPFVPPSTLTLTAILARSLPAIGTYVAESSVTAPEAAAAGAAAVTSVLSYSMTGGYGGSALSVPVAPVSQVTAATRSGSSSTQAFAFTVSPKNSSSAIVITSMTSAASKVGDPAGAWTLLSQTTWADLGSSVSFNAKQPSGNYAASATISGTVDGVPFTVASN